MAVKSPDEVPQEVRDEISELVDRLRIPNCKELMRRDALTEKERQWAAKHITKQEWKETDAIHLYMKIRSVSDIVAILDLGACCGHLDPHKYRSLRSQIGINEVDYGVDLQRAVNEADLVVDEFRRLVIWQKREFNIDSDDKIWTYFWKLSCAASNGSSIGPEDFSYSAQTRNLGDWKSRLGDQKGFPLDLWELIVVKAGRHRLKVNAQQIRVFPMKQPGALV